MSEVKVNKISPRTNCGTVTLGDSGDSFVIPAGATITNNGTQVGFGRSGSVNWDTTAKTASFTAVSGNGYFVNTTSGAVTITLPATPSAGDIVSVKDYAQTFDTNNLTVGRNGEPINGGNVSDPTVSTKGASITFIYVDGTQGWVPTQDDQSTLSGISPYIQATGGTITTCGDYKIHTFTSPGTFCVTTAGTPAGSDTVDYLVVAGGGGGNASVAGGGGGAGGFRYSASTYCSPACAPAHPLRSATGLSVSTGANPVTVGAGGSGTPGRTPGSNSSFSTITSAGGGGGDDTGGSGGGRTHRGGSGFAGNTPPVSPPQGNAGGDSPFCIYSAGGGGGATAAGANATGPLGSGAGGAGGAGGGLPSAFGTSGVPSGSFYYFSGGGGGGSANNTPVPGGIGGGGTGGSPASAGTANTGGGGGGNSPSSPTGQAGGSGIVIIRYKFQN